MAGGGPRDRARELVRRCLRRDLLPAHVAVDAEAWRENSDLALS